MARRSTKFAIAIASAILALTSSELFCRAAVARANQDRLAAALADEVPIPVDGRVYFKHLIRLNANPHIIYELKPGIEDVEYLGAALSTNSLGFRGPEVGTEKTKKTIRVLGIGDSVMFGQAVRDEETYFRGLERALNQRLPNSRWEFINTAVPGYNAVLEVETLVEKGLQLDVDIIFLGVVSNDFELPLFTQAARDPWTLEKFYLPDFVLHQGEDDAAAQEAPGLSGRDRKRDYDALSDPDAQPESFRGLVGQPAFRAAMERLAEVSQAQNIPVIVFSYKQSRVSVQMLEIAQEFGFVCISTHAQLRDYRSEQDMLSKQAFDESDLVVSPTDHHPSAKLHGMLVDWMLDNVGLIVLFKRFEKNR